MREAFASNEINQLTIGKGGRQGRPIGEVRASSSDEAAAKQSFTLLIPNGAPRQIAAGWLLLGLSSLAGAGLFAILLVMSRTPLLDQHFPWIDFFHVALVMHVNLSIMVWFLTFASVFWNLNAVRRGQQVGWVALAVATGGTALMAVSAFISNARPLMSNYVPVLYNRLFLWGLTVFGAGIAIQVVLSLCYARPLRRGGGGSNALRFGINTAAVAAGVTLLSFALSYLGTPRIHLGRAYFNQMFWGGGHLLQYTYVQLMLVTWLWLAARSGCRTPLSPRLVVILFAWGLVPVFLTPIAYLAYAPDSAVFRQFFQWLMIFGGSLTAGPIGLAVVYGLVAAAPPPAENAPQRAALVGSLNLFAIGGLLGFIIHGNNVTVPAHYHGCIGAVTLAFMGATYEFLPRLGFRAPALRAARWQAYLYTAGESFHVFGLAWAGEYGVFRKVAGVAQGLRGWDENVAMAFMGIGGLIAVIAGGLFLIICIRALFGKQRMNARSASVVGV